MRRFVLFVICLFFLKSTFALDTIYIDSTVKTIPILEHIYIYEDKTNELNIDNIHLVDDQFKKNTRTSLNFGLSTSTYWLKFNLRNISSLTSPFILKIANPDLNFINFYEIINDSVTRSILTGEKIKFDSKHGIQNFFLFNLNLKPNKNQCYLLAINNQGYSNYVPIKLESKSFFEQNNITEKIVHWLVYGLLLFVVIFNFYLFYSLRDKINLYYTLYVFFIVLFLIFNDGYHFYLNISPVLNYIKIIPVILVIVYLINFSRVFLETKQRWPKLDKVFNILKIVNLTFGIFYFLDYPLFLFLMYLMPLTIIFTSISVIICSVLVLNRNYLPSVFFLFAFFSMLVGAILYQLKDLGLLPSNLFYENSVRIGITIESILLTIAVLERFRIQQRHAQKSIEDNRVNQMKLNFFTNVSHEFRTPLSLILAPVDKLIESDNNKIRGEQYTTIRKNALQLGKLVDQVLDFRKLDVGQTALQLKKGDIIQFTKDIASSFISLAEKQEVKLRVDSQVSSYNMYFDHEKIEKVLHNILSNAFKFTPAKGEISVNMTITNTLPKRLETRKTGKPQFLTISINDTGKGIAEDYHQEIFKPYYQVPGTEYGTGIGLAITDEYVKSHQGIIELDSKPGKGSKFTIYLPTNLEEIFTVVEEGSATARSDQIKASESVILERKEEEEKELEAGEKLKSTVLLVEDNREIIQYLENALENDYTILTAENGKQALEIAIQEIPELIISDIMMPVMDGITFCRKVKTDERTSHVPVILLTAKAGEESKIEGLEHGADDYIVKPFSIKEIKARVKNLIVQRQKLREKFTRELASIEPGNVTDNKLDEEFLKKAMGVVEHHMEDIHFTSEQFVSEMNMSRSLVYMKLKTLVDQSASQFITTIRVRAAARLLHEQPYSVTDLAYKVGFNDPNYFSRSFKKLFHKSPSAYIREMKK